MRHHRGEGIRVRERRCRKGDVSPRGEWGGAQGRWESEGGGVAGEIGEVGDEWNCLSLENRPKLFCSGVFGGGNFWWEPIPWKN